MDQATERPSRRIMELDGLRAVAILGVLYAHVWAFGCGMPQLRVGPVDVNRLLSVFGTGVDLFFVISGFCMYMMYASKSQGFDLTLYRSFLQARARRIMPAYLAALLFAACVWLVSRGQLPVREVIAHMAFAQTLVPGATSLAAPFWSLAAEWHFYMVLPLLLLLGRKLGLGRALWGSFLLSIAFRVASAHFEGSPVQLDMQLPARLCEFVLGVVVARTHLGGVELSRWLRGAKGAALGLLVMLLGRLAMMDGVVHGRGILSTLAMAVNVPVLSLGYAMLVWNVIASDSVVARALRAAPIRWLGRVSYSFYLWHWFPALWIGSAMTAHFEAKGFLPIAATLVSTAVIAPIAALSYRLFEAPYLERRQDRGIFEAGPVASAAGSR